jgi:hypothetical protein
MPTDEWIGIDQVAAEMKYSRRQAWEFVRSIGLVVVNVRSMGLVRFTRADFNDARERAKAPLPPRVRTGAVPSAAAASPRKAASPSAASIASKRAKLRGA